MRCEVCGEHIVEEQTTCPYCSSVIRRQTLSDKDNILLTEDKNFDIGQYSVSVDEGTESGNDEERKQFSVQKNNGKSIKTVHSGDAYISSGGNSYNAYNIILNDHLDKFDFGSGDDAPKKKVQLSKNKLAKNENETSSSISISASIKSKQYSFKDKKKITLQKRNNEDIYAEPDCSAVTFESVDEPPILKSGRTEVRGSAHAIGHIPGGVVLPRGISRSEFMKIHQISDIRTAFYISVILMYFYVLLVVISSIFVFRHPLFLLDAIVVLVLTFFIQTRYSVKLSLACFIYSFVDLLLALMFTRYIGVVLFSASILSWITLSGFDKLYSQYQSTGIVMDRRIKKE